MLNREVHVSSFAQSLVALVTPLDPNRHAYEIGRLRSCRSLRDLEQLASDGWLTPGARDPRLKLVRHGSGTYLVVQYVDGWSSRLSMAPFHG